MPPKLQLLDLPNELIEHILFLLCLESPRDIITCRLVCGALNALVKDSVLVKYLMHVSLLGAYDPFAVGVAAPALPERMTELLAWDDAWSVVGDLLQHEPDVRIAPPDMDIDVDFESDDTSTSTSRRLRHRYSFNPWFIVAAREGPHLRAGYSYLDVHECYRRTTAAGDAATSAQCTDDEYQWTRVEAPVRNAIVLALAPELDLAVAISGERADHDAETMSGPLEVHPFRFRDGMRHPCAKMPVISVPAAGASGHSKPQVQVLGDYLLLWIGGPATEGDAVSRVFLIAWKEGTITLLRESPAGAYGSIPAMISEDILAFVQLNPPGIELCRVSNMNQDSSGSVPHVSKLCTLLLPPLKDGARTDWAICVGEHPGHQKFSNGPWAEYHRAPPHRPFHLSTRNSIVSTMIQITGKNGRVRIYDMAVRSATLLEHVTAMDATSGISLSSDGGRVVPWAEWGPHTTSMSDHTHIGWNDLLGERRAMIDASGLRMRIRDYNPYRIWRASRPVESSSVPARRRQGSDPDLDTDQDEGFRRRRPPRTVNKTSSMRAGEWFEDDVVTALPYVDVVIYIPGCRAIHMQQDQLLLHVDDFSRRPPAYPGPVEQFFLYRM